MGILCLRACVRVCICAGRGEAAAAHHMPSGVRPRATAAAPCFAFIQRCALCPPPSPLPPALGLPTTVPACPPAQPSRTPKPLPFPTLPTDHRHPPPPDLASEMSPRDDEGGGAEDEEEVLDGPRVVHDAAGSFDPDMIPGIVSGEHVVEFYGKYGQDSAVKFFYCNRQGRGWGGWGGCGLRHQGLGFRGFKGLTGSGSRPRRAPRQVLAQQPARGVRARHGVGAALMTPGCACRLCA